VHSNARSDSLQIPNIKGALLQLVGMESHLIPSPRSMSLFSLNRHQHNTLHNLVCWMEAIKLQHSPTQLSLALEVKVPSASEMSTILAMCNSRKNINSYVPIVMLLPLLLLLLLLLLFLYLKLLHSKYIILSVKFFQFSV
jgi:hypothetical protein